MWRGRRGCRGKLWEGVEEEGWRVSASLFIQIILFQISGVFS